MCKRETHRDVDVLHFLRDGVEYGKQQGFVAEDYGVLFFFVGSGKSTLYPFRKKAGLRVLGRSGDIAYVLRLPQSVETTFGEFINRNLKLFPNELPES